MKVSVIMATYNKREYLPYSLASLSAQTYDDFELVICDDGTDPGVADLLSPYRGRFDIIDVVQPNAGRAAARNAALSRATGDLIIFSDDDRIVPPDFIAAHAKAHEASQGAVIGWKKRVLTVWRPRSLPLSESDLITLAQRLGGHVDRLTEPFELIRPADIADSFDDAMRRIDMGDDPAAVAAVAAKYGDDLEDFRFGWVLASTANLSVGREVLDGVGHFDTGYKGWGAEDTDLAYRLWRAGVCFRIDRSACNFHQIHPIGTGNVPLDSRRRNTELMANIDYFCRKHRTVEAYLFRRRFTHAITFDEANRVLTAVAADSTGAAADELLRLYTGTEAGMPAL